MLLQAMTLVMDYIKTSILVPPPPPPLPILSPLLFNLQTTDIGPGIELRTNNLEMYTNIILKRHKTRLHRLLLSPQV